MQQTHMNIEKSLMQYNLERIYDNSSFENQRDNIVLETIQEINWISNKEPKWVQTEKYWMSKMNDIITKEDSKMFMEIEENEEPRVLTP